MAYLSNFKYSGLQLENIKMEDKT